MMTKHRVPSESCSLTAIQGRAIKPAPQADGFDLANVGQVKESVRVSLCESVANQIHSRVSPCVSVANQAHFS